MHIVLSAPISQRCPGGGRFECEPLVQAPMCRQQFFESCVSVTTSKEPLDYLVLAWQLNEGFKYDPALVTEVEVTFTLLGPKLTRVDFEHRDLERFGEAAERLRGAMDTGWGQILESYKRTAIAEAA